MIIFKLVRSFVGWLILWHERTFPPKPLLRNPDAQARVNAAAQNLQLYQFATCPFCVKVRRAAKGLNIPLTLRDIQKNKEYEEELIKGGGQRQVPCLRIEEKSGAPRWLYESTDIIKYLQEKFP